MRLSELPDFGHGERERMQIIKSKFNTTGWLGTVLFIVPWPLLGVVYWAVEDSNRSRISVWETVTKMERLRYGVASDPFPEISQISPWLIVLCGASLLLGLVLMVVGRDSYVQEASQ